jgi:phage tail sheath gpL-like
VVILGEANAANQDDLDTSSREVTTLAKCGELYGFGSPIYHAMRILRPISGSGLGGIPTIVMAQEEADAAAARVLEVTISGTATGNGTHRLKIAGRFGVDGQTYDINIAKDDTSSEITQKIEDAVNAVIGSPVSAASTDYEATLTTKWKGLTAQDVSVEVDRGDNDLGLTYTVTQTAAGSGTPSIASALSSFGNTWNTIVVNTYGTVTSIMDALEATNGIPDPDSPTGKFSGTIMKPFVALTGSTADNPSTITDTRLNDVTISICPAPLSDGLPLEAAANVCALWARTVQDTPQSDISGRSYPDMPTPTSIGTMAVYANRDSYVKKGCSTVDLVGGRYQIQDFVTTYHPVGEVVPQFRYVRNLYGVDLNVYYAYYLKEQLNVMDKVIANDNDIVSAQNVIKPKQWKGIVANLAEDFGKRALIADVAFMQDSIIVQISSTNPDRLETFFRYKRTGTVRIASTDATAGFNFGSN